MDKSHLLPEGMPLLARWLEAWWHKTSPAPKIGLIMENGPPGRNFSATHIEWPRLMICLEGGRSYRLEGGGKRQGRMRAGQALYFAPGVWLSPLPVRRFRSLGVHWEPGRIRLILREDSPFAPPKAVWTLEQATGDGRRLDVRIATLATRPSGRCAAEALLLLELGLLIERLHAASHPGHGRRHALYLRVCAFLEEQFAQPHTRESVATRFGISPGHLTRLFREEGGIGFNTFLNSLRLHEAEVLLASTALSVQQIALQCGFADPAYFSRLFRKRHGLSPGRAKPPPSALA